ncbi:MAG: tetratricopeptide repeat protein [Bacteroidales bacterium]|nr:tetratricopeptide repeat protein [Bacteroidales bacterium]
MPGTTGFYSPGTDDPYLALKLYFQSLALCEKAGDSGGMAKVYNVLGFYKGQTGQFDSAVLLLNRAMEINRQLNDRRNMIENLGNLGYVYRQNGKNAEAEKIYHSLIAELIARNDSSSLPVIYYNMAAFRQEDHQLDSAIYYLRKAMVIAEITGDTALLSTLYGNTGEILMDKGSFDSSKVYLNRCLQYSILTDDVETQLQALKFLIKADTLSGKYNDIGSLYNRITVLQDSVFERKQRNNSRTIELQYENEKKRNLIELQEIEIQSKTKVRNLLLLLLITVIAAVVLLGRMIFLRKKNYLKDKLLLENKIQLNQLQLDQLKKDEEINRLSIEKYQDALYIKEKELVSIALGIEQKNELLDLISKRIQESYQKGTDLASLNQIVGSIKAQLTESEDADLFNQRFTNLHQDFFTKLQDAHPELSKTELKFCAYLRIQLSGNQIASIMNVTTEAIRKTRYRIRKKWICPGMLPRKRTL